GERSTRIWLGGAMTRSGQRRASAGAWHGLGRTAASAATGAVGGRTGGGASAGSWHGLGRTAASAATVAVAASTCGASGCQIARHLVERGHVEVDGLVGVGHRERPLLLAAGR